MKEEQERLLKYIGEIFEKRRMERRRSGSDDSDVSKTKKGIYDDLHSDIVKAGKKIRAIREEKKISIERLAAITGLTESYIKEIEFGMADPYMTEMYDITKVLEIELSSLFEH